MQARKRVGLLAAALLVTLGFAATPTAYSQGTAAGCYATSLVDQNQYEYVHGNLLYTHDGDDRSWGPEHDLARDNIQALFVSYGLETTLHPFTWGASTLYNVVGESPGTTRPDDIYVIGAHFDSRAQWGGCPGADDNATGVAAVLEIARLVSQWPSAATIRLIAFDREEQGLIGSGAYATDHAQDNIRAMVSLDMLGYQSWIPLKAQIRCEDVAAELKSGLAAAVMDYSKLDPITDSACHCSDHAPFADLGIPAALLSELGPESNPMIHTQGDSLDTPGYIDYEFAVHITRAALGWLVDTAGVTPTLVGDLNCDYAVDERDVNPFVQALTNPAAYAATYPDCPQFNADANGDGAVSFADISPLLTHLLQPCQEPQVVGSLWPTAGNAHDLFGTAMAAGVTRW